MNWPFGAMPMFGYDVIDADPPWFFELYDVVTGGKKSAHAQYECMSLDEIKALPVGQLAGSNCLLTLWTTGWAMARGDALDVCRAWGATPISEIVWRKTFASGKPAMGPGYRVRTMHEPILLATFGNPEHKPFPSSFDGVRREHSRKPDEWYEMLVKHTPSALRRACLFSAGRDRPGFDCWGEPHQERRERKNDDVDQAGGGPRRAVHPSVDGAGQGTADLFGQRPAQMEDGRQDDRGERGGVPAAVSQAEARAMGQPGAAQSAPAGGRTQEDHAAATAADS